MNAVIKCVNERKGDTVGRECNDEQIDGGKGSERSAHSGIRAAPIVVRCTGNVIQTPTLFVSKVYEACSFVCNGVR